MRQARTRSTALGQTVLVVDDETGLRELTETVLKRHGYNVLAASDGPEALGLLAQHCGKIKLVFTSIRLPSMDGPALAGAVRRIDARVPIMASSTQGSSFNQSDKLTALRSVGICRVLAKPFSTGELLQAIREELGWNPCRPFQGT